MDPLLLFLKRLEVGKVNSMMIALRQLQCAGHPRAAVEMPHPPTYQAYLAAPQVAFLAGPGIKKSPQEQEVPSCSPVDSRWKVGLLLMEIVWTDLRIQGCFPRSRQECMLATPRNPDPRFSLWGHIPFFIRYKLFCFWKPLPTPFG